MELTGAAELQTYEATIWEKAEHWRFYVNYQATSREEALKMAKAEYGGKDYVIKDVR